MFNPEHLFVVFNPPVGNISPINGRKYTLTHSDQTGYLFLTIGLTYDEDKITDLRDEVLAEWSVQDGVYMLCVKVYLGNGEFKTVKRRDRIFRQKLPLALEAIFLGDRAFLMAHEQLYAAPIKICFESSNSSYHRCENWGTPMDYLFYAN
ncbi:staygreen family protein [Amphibacillus jilinensis]|uniref:staygreen family protein n=1 Tax=Amphibacillus jilinensis TaxID=1216008 RepID=UPI00031C0F49|nr:staygreen family protein [Amphibacillus jilinensis]